MKALFAAMMTALTIASAVQVVQACINPGLLGHMGFRRGSTVKFSFVGSGWTTTQKDCVEDAFEKWQAKVAGSLNVTFVRNSSQPQITITKTTLPPGKAAGTTSPSLDGDGYTVGIGIQYSTNTQLVSTCAGFMKFGLHEIGHILGLADTFGTGGSSVMNQGSGGNDSGGNIATDVTNCDRDMAKWATPEEQPHGCYNGGCPPGYTSSCREDEIPDPENCNCCPDFTPIVVDTADGGFRFSSAEDGVTFAINSMGSMLRLGWPQQADDMWLVRDLNGNGVVDNGSELFGNTTALRTGFAEHGYEALNAIDRNRDGVINASDPAFKQLQLWSDANRNGFSEPQELFSVEQMGLTSLSTDFRESRRTDRWGNRFRYYSTARIFGRRTAILTVDVYPATCPY